MRMKYSIKIPSLLIPLLSVALLAGCTLPLPDPDYELKKAPPPPECVCTGICEGYELPKQLDCPCFPPICPTADLNPALELVKDEKIKECKNPDIECLIKDLACQVEQGCIFAAVCLGHMYLVGDQVPKNIELAVHWYRKAAAGGVTLAMVQMGYFYRDGIGVCRNGREAVCWFEKAAGCGDITAMIALGEMYKGWHTFPSNYKKSLHWYQKAACLGSTEAEFQVGLLLTHGIEGCKKFNEGIEILTCAAEEGNIQALVSLGDLYYEGRLGPRDLARAAEFFKAAGSVSGEAAFKLGLIFATGGPGIFINMNEAVKWFLLAADKRYGPAMLYVAQMYRDGIGVQKSYKAAAQWYMRSIEEGMTRAYVELADLYHAGKGVPRVLELAAKYYHLAADTCVEPYAELMLSIMYETGRGVPFDLTKSVAHYNRACRQPGFLLAEYRIGRRYKLGVGLPENMERAMYWFLLAGNSGLALAQAELGDIYLSGRNEIAEDYNQAYYWYHKAALQGYTYAQNSIGLMWLHSCPPFGVSPLIAKISTKAALAKAVFWISKAAYKGDKQAQYQLGLLHWEGIGVPQSDPVAYAWIYNALENLEDVTPAEIVALIREMNPEMKEKAVRLTEAFRSRYFGNVLTVTKGRGRSGNGSVSGGRKGVCMK